MAVSRSERLLADDYLGDLSARPIEEIRSMRAECQDVELGLSYLRRLLQGRIDVVAAELQRRADGGAPTDLTALIERLPGALSDHGRSEASNRLTSLDAPSDADLRELQAELDAVVDEGRLAALPDLADEDVRGLVDHLTELERSVSQRRHALHERIDALQAELTRRYKSGEASVDSLLRDR